MSAETKTFPWLAVSLLITGLIVGYGTVTVTSTNNVHASNGAVCPMQADCNTGNCTANCPGNCNRA